MSQNTERSKSCSISHIELHSHKFGADNVEDEACESCSFIEPVVEVHERNKVKPKKSKKLFQVMGFLHLCKLYSLNSKVSSSVAKFMTN